MRFCVYNVQFVVNFGGFYDTVLITVHTTYSRCSECHTQYNSIVLFIRLLFWIRFRSFELDIFLIQQPMIPKNDPFAMPHFKILQNNTNFNFTIARWQWWCQTIQHKHSHNPWITNCICEWCSDSARDIYILFILDIAQIYKSLQRW